jgi:hypothetical protein
MTNDTWDHVFEMNVRVFLNILCFCKDFDAKTIRDQKEYFRKKGN